MGIWNCILKRRNNMSIEELAQRQLVELYEFNLENLGNEATISYPTRYKSKKTKEHQIHLAYEYLAKKGLVYYRFLYDGFYELNITRDGINYIKAIS